MCVFQVDVNVSIPFYLLISSFVLFCTSIVVEQSRTKLPFYCQW